MAGLLMLARLPLSLSRGESPTSGILFRTDFSIEPQDQALPSPWKCGSGTFTVEDRRLHITSKRQNPTVRLAREFSGYHEILARFIGADKFHWCGLIFLSKYRMTVNNQFGTASLEKLGKGGVEPLASARGWKSKVKFPDNFLMRVRIEDKTITGYLDGQKVVSAVLEEAPPSGEIGFAGGWDTNLYIDEVLVRSLAPGSARELPPLVALLDARTGRPDSVYYDGEKVPVTLRLRNGRGWPVRILVRFRLLDFHENLLDARARQIVLPATGEKRLHLIYQPHRRGVFKIAVDAGEAPGALNWMFDALSFSVLQKGIARDVPAKDSPFGLHCEQIGAELTVALAGKIGAKWARGHDTMQHTYWFQVERNPGEFVWWGDGKNQKILDAAGMRFLGMFAFTPWWAAHAPNALVRKPTLKRSVFGFYPPKDWALLAQYVTKVVEHYPQIPAWEIWNEPFTGGFWRGTVGEYVKLSKVCYQAAKRARKDCIVVGGGGQSLHSLAVVEEILKRGAGQYMDAFSIHGYSDAVEPLPAAEIEGDLPKLRSLLKKYHCDVPIWNTEWGCRSTSFLDQERKGLEDTDAPYHFREAADRMARTLVTNLAAGIVRTIYYANWIYGPYERRRQHPTNTNIVEGNGALKPMGVAYATTASLLSGGTFVSRERPLPWLTAYIFSQQDEAVGVHWGLFGKFKLRTEVRLQLPSGIKAGQVKSVDIMGNETPVPVNTDGSLILPVSLEPVFLRIRESSPAHLRQLYASAEPLVPFEVPAPRADEKPAKQLQGDFEGVRGIPEEQWCPIDLRSYCNMGFADDAPGDAKGGWTDEGPFNDIRDMPTGRRTWYGVPFRVIVPAENAGRSCIALQSAHAPALLREAKGIGVKQKLVRLFFLHSAGWAPSDPKAIYCRYFIHYENGMTREVPVRGKLDNDNWWTPPQEGAKARTVPIAIRRSVRDADKERYLRIMEWTNPDPSIRIDSMDFVSSAGNAIPILIAVTGIRLPR